MTRVLGARDLGNGIELKRQMLGHLSSLQVHHIFPKAQLYDAGYGRGEVNSVANFCFLTQQTNLDIGKRLPAEYLADIERRHPGALASQWIPTDPALWTLERYPQFLTARRDLLARAANAFLNGLLESGLPSTEEPLPRIALLDPTSGDDEMEGVRDLRDEVLAMGLAEPTVDVEIVEPVTGRAVAVAELFWKDGLQAGQGSPVVLDIDPDPVGMAHMEELGYDVFTSVDALRAYLHNRAREAAGETGMADESSPRTPVNAGVVAAPGGEQDPAVARERFGRAMRDIYVRALKETGYRATPYLDMLQRYGALGTAKRLLAAPAVSDGFTALRRSDRLDLTVESVVLRPEFATLFTNAERDTAHVRLTVGGYPTEG